MEGMFGNSDRSRALFEARFEPDGDGFLFRGSPTGYPVRLTLEERDRFIVEFTRGVRLLIVGSAVAIFVMVAAMLTMAPDTLDGLKQNIALWLIALSGLVPFFFLWARLWNAPRRALAGRSPAGPARTAAEARRHALDRISWAQLSGAAGLAVVHVAMQWTKHDLTQGWYRLWLVFGVAMVVLASVQAFRKWRLGQRG